MVIPYIVDGLGERNIVTFRENLTEILREHYSKLAECKTKEQRSSMVIIEAAAKIIKSDVKTNIKSNVDTYPESVEFDNTHGMMIFDQYPYSN